jgi:dephospho-CoA kinase
VKVVGITGMPGSGKSEAVAVARDRGIPVVRMGDLVWEEVDRQGLPRDAAHVGQVADAMRKQHGDDVWALRTVERVRAEARRGGMVVIDGIRSNHEVEVFQRELGADFLLVAIHTDPGERHARLTRRARADDPTASSAHLERDQREMAWGIARTIVLADEMIVNDATLDAFRAEVAGLLDELAE